MQKNRRHFSIIAVLILISTYLVHLVLNVVMTFPAAASQQAAEIDLLKDGHIWLIAFLFSLVIVFMLYSLVVFRRRPGDETEGQFIHGNTALEIIWTVIPILLVLAFSYWGTVVLTDITHASAGELVVDVQGMQWAWSFSYPDSGATSTELVLPVNTPVRLDMTSKDVIHSFFVPEFRVKQDLVPGHTTHLRFTPIKIGQYKLRCAELCGLNHSGMLADVRVVAQDEFAIWSSKQVQGTSQK